MLKFCMGESSCSALLLMLQAAHQCDCGEHPSPSLQGAFKGHTSIRQTTTCIFIWLPKIKPVSCCPLWLVSSPSKKVHTVPGTNQPNLLHPGAGWTAALSLDFCRIKDDRSLWLPLEMMLQYWSVTTSNWSCNEVIFQPQSTAFFSLVVGFYYYYLFCFLRVCFFFSNFISSAGN